MKKITFYLILNSIFFSLCSQEFTRIDGIHPCIDAGYSWGVSWVDFDNDGWPDIYVTNMQEDNCLYRNLGDGTFEKVTNSLTEIFSQSGVFNCRGSSWADYDNDGDVDCFLATGTESELTKNYFFINNGDGSFSIDTISIFTNDELNSVGAAWIDYDVDGDLDLHVINHDTWPTSGVGEAVIYNNENNSFSKITDLPICSEVKDCNHSSWADFDNDGLFDLFTPSHTTNNRLFKNEGNGSFELLNNSIVTMNGMGTACGSWGDYDNDGDMDLYVPKLLEGPCFYRNNNGEFEKIEDMIITNDGFGIGASSWFDCDNDGDLDLLVTRWNYYNDVNNTLFLNEDGNFTKETNSIVVTDETQNNGFALCDYDKDGDLDMYLCQFTSDIPLPNILYRNETSGNHWVILKCVGVNSNKAAIGTTVRVKAVIDGEPVWQMRQITNMHSGGGQNALDLHFGLKDASVIDSIIVVWPSGLNEYYINVFADDYYTITEGGGIVHVSEYPQNIQKVYPNPSNGIIKIRMAKQLPIKIYQISGKCIFEKNYFPNEKLDLSGFEKGIYILEIIDIEYNHQQKIIIN
jgi:hypothetical protein